MTYVELIMVYYYDPLFIVFSQEVTQCFWLVKIREMTLAWVKYIRGLRDLMKTIEWSRAIKKKERFVNEESYRDYGTFVFIERIKLNVFWV